MKNTPHLSLGYAPVLAKQIAATRPGMAHFAATGPFGATCGTCAFFGYYQQIHSKAGDTIATKWRGRSCGKFFELTQNHGPAIPACTEACRHFEQRDGRS
jgi:hypothetical protein